jgi:hypothetical protein
MTIPPTYETPATRLANTLSSDDDQRPSFVNYFQNNSSGQERQATLDQIVEILHEDKAKLEAFFTALDDIFQQEAFTHEHYGPIEAIVGALFDKGVNMLNKVHSLAKNSKWGRGLYNFWLQKDHIKYLSEFYFPQNS